MLPIAMKKRLKISKYEKKYCKNTFLLENKSLNLLPLLSFVLFKADDDFFDLKQQNFVLKFIKIHLCAFGRKIRHLLHEGFELAEGWIANKKHWFAPFLKLKKANRFWTIGFSLYM